MIPCLRVIPIVEVENHLRKKLQQPLGVLSHSQRKRPELDVPVEPRVEVEQDGAVPAALLAFTVRVTAISDIPRGILRSSQNRHLSELFCDRVPFDYLC